MTRELKARTALFFGALMIVLIVSSFLWIINDDLDIKSILFLSGLSVGVMALFFYHGNYFSANGEIQSNMIVIMIVCILVLIQLAFQFQSYGTQMAEFRLRVFNQSIELVGRLDESKVNEYNQLMTEACNEDFEYIAICSPDGKVLFTPDRSKTGTYINDDKAQSFVLYSGNRLYTRSSDSYEKGLSREALINQLTLLVTSVLFSVEFVVFVVRKVSNSKIVGAAAEDASPAILSSVRQVAFIFYFASRLCASFIPTMAKSLPASGLALPPNMLAALPQTTETLFVCISVVFSSRFLEKKGWKTPFITGLGFTFAGTAGCMLAPNLIIFAASRALIGFGYGFCWMTLRSVALLGKSEEQRLVGFSMLSAGLYAGMYCGSTVGSIIAGKFGYSTVFLLSVVLIALCSVNIFTMVNSYLPKAEKEENKESGKITGKEITGLALFAITMIAPVCIVESYADYFLPLFYESLGRSVLDTGRVQLLYGIVIVYLGPPITRIMARKIKNQLASNCLFLGMEIAALMLVGIRGTFLASVAGMVIIALADSFGSGIQNSYYMHLPFNRHFAAGKSLMHLSLLKKLTSMTGPTVFAFAMGASTFGVFGMGAVFAVFTAGYAAFETLFGREKTKEAAV